jgi:hypothetical protein
VALQPASNPTSRELDIAAIRKLATDAVTVMFNRAVEFDPDTPVVEDKKIELLLPLPSKGALQDCEFGVILLLVRAWIGNDLFASIDCSVFHRVVKSLVKRTVNRLSDPLELDEGGNGNHIAFFAVVPIHAQYEWTHQIFG